MKEILPEIDITPEEARAQARRVLEEVQARTRSNPNWNTGVMYREYREYIDEADMKQLLEEDNALNRDRNRRMLLAISEPLNPAPHIFDVDESYTDGVAYLTDRKFAGLGDTTQYFERDQRKTHNRILHLVYSQTEIGFIEFFNVLDEGINLSGLSEQTVAAESIRSVNPDIVILTDPQKK